MKKEGLFKVCKNCKTSCCKLGGAEFTKKEMQRVLKSGYPNYFIKINDNHYETKTKRGACAYLNKDNSCKIQKIKPKMCWAWPVNLGFSGKKKIYYLMQCPLTPYLKEEDIKKMKKQMSDYTKEFIYCSNTKMPDSEVDLVIKRYHKFKKKRLK